MSFLKKKVLRAWNSPTLTTWLSFVTVSLRAAVVLPLVVSMLDPQRIALYYLLTSIIGIAGFAGAAFKVTYTRCFSYIHEGATQLKDFEQVNCLSNNPDIPYLKGVYQKIKEINFSVSLFSISTGILLAIIILIKQGKQLENAYAELWITCFLFIVTLYVNSWLLLHRSYLEGVGKIALTNRLTVVGGITAMALTAAFLLQDWNLYAFGVANLIGALIRYYLLNKEAKKSQISLKKVEALSVQKEVKEAVYPPSIRQSVLSLLSTGVDRGAGLIAALFMTGETLASYLQALSLLFLIMGFSYAPFYSQIPRYSALRSSGKIERLATALGKGMSKSFLAFTFAAVGVTLFVPILFYIVGSNIGFLDHRLWGFLCLSYLLDRHTAMTAQIYSTLNKVPLFKLGIITGLAKVVLMYFLGKEYGVLGLISGYAVSNIVISFCMPYVSLRTLDAFWKKNVKLYVPTLIGCFLIIGIATWYSPYVEQFSIELLTSLGFSK